MCEPSSVSQRTCAGVSTGGFDAVEDLVLGEWNLSEARGQPVIVTPIDPVHRHLLDVLDPTLRSSPERWVATDRFRSRTGPSGLGQALS